MSLIAFPFVGYLIRERRAAKPTPPTHVMRSGRRLPSVKAVLSLGADHGEGQLVWGRGARNRLE